MDDILIKLSSALMNKSENHSEELNKLGVHTSLDSKHIRTDVPIIILAVNGRTELSIGSRNITIEAGELLALPPTEIYFLNQYSEQCLSAMRLIISFSSNTLSHFRKSYGDILSKMEYSPKHHIITPKVIISTIYSWLNRCSYYTPSPLVIQHRQSELLLLLIEAGVASNLLFQYNSSWEHRVNQLIGMDPGKCWKMNSVCRQLGISEASLRRYLCNESTSFREILEDSRLTAALSLLKKTNWNISKIAEEVGYQSQSRFGARFKLKYGIPPSELRRIRQVSTDYTEASVSMNITELACL